MKLKPEILKWIILALILTFCNALRAQSISASGSWTPSVTPITEAGNNYASSTLESAANQTLISVSMPPQDLLFIISFANNYQVWVKRTDSGPNWNTAGLQLFVKRTGSGTGGGTSLLLVPSAINNGLTYQQITTSDVQFFDGYNFGNSTRSGIPIQYQITGVSVLVPAATYSTTITYTLVDN